VPRKVIRKERGVFEKVAGSDIWWIQYKVDGVEHILPRPHPRLPSNRSIRPAPLYLHPPRTAHPAEQLR